MKLLLTSAGLSNQSIVKALEDLLGKSANGVKLAFIPTAANVVEGDKHWMIDDFNNCRQAGLEIDIVDISATAKDVWLPRIQTTEVLLFGGGNTFHLRHWLKKSGLEDLLPDLLKSRVYVGISAGGCVVGPTINNSVQNLFGEKSDLEIKDGLGLLDLQIIPHLNSDYFVKIRKENLKVASKDIKEPVYALDDQSALIVNNQEIEVVSEGTWYRFN